MPTTGPGASMANVDKPRGPYASIMDYIVHLDQKGCTRHRLCIDRRKVNIVKSMSSCDKHSAAPRARERVSLWVCSFLSVCVHV